VLPLATELESSVRPMTGHRYLIKHGSHEKTHGYCIAVTDMQHRVDGMLDIHRCHDSFTNR
jgi:hypothetical protein